MSIAMTYDSLRLATSLLDACCAATGAQGGTIHQFLHRLKWEYAGVVARQGPTWYLKLDGSIHLGWYSGLKKHLPTIEPGLCAGHLDRIPVNLRPLR